MKILKFPLHSPTADPIEVWRSSLEKLNWQPWALHNSITAAFAKAVWLYVSAPVAVEVVQEVCAKHHQPLANEALWEAWFACVRQLNGYPDEAELEVA